MSDPLRLDCPTLDEIPSMDRLRELATQDQHVVLQFPQSLTLDQKRTIITKLRPELPNWSVFDSGGTQTTENITVKKVIDRNQIIAHADQIVDAARAFRSIAESLCRQLAAKKQIQPSELLEHQDHGRKLQDGWKYCFHGLQCRFENKQTKQIVEVEISFGDEFGVLDPYFFGLFMSSTPQFKSLVNMFPDLYHDTSRALDVLEEIGRLVHVGNDGTYPKSGVVAR